MNLPVPANFQSWQAWATKLIDQLKKPAESQVAKTRTYLVADVPPPIEDGMVIIVSNEVGGTTLAISLGGSWLRVKDGATIS